MLRIDAHTRPTLASCLYFAQRLPWAKQRICTREVMVYFDGRELKTYRESVRAADLVVGSVYGREDSTGLEGRRRVLHRRAATSGRHLSSTLSRE